MLSRLTKANRVRAAFVLALFYALCSVAPSAAFAFGDDTRAAHCLVGDDHELHAMHPHKHSSASVHVHADGTSHEHGNLADSGKTDEHGKKSDTKCCGLVSINAIPATGISLVIPTLAHVTLVLPQPRDGPGQIASLPYRPPNSLAVVLN